MKEILEIIALLLPLVKDVILSSRGNANAARRRRILRILQNKDITQLERLTRLLGLTIRGAEIIRYTDDGVEVNEQFVLEFARMEKELRRIGE